MARRRRRRSRRFGDFISVPLGLGKFKLPSVKSLNPLNRAVNSTHVILGAFVGLAGSVLLSKGIQRFWPTAPAFVQNYLGPITTVGAGALALVALKNKHKATGIFAGAALVGLVPLVYGAVAPKIPFLADYVNVNYGLLTDVAPMGLLVDEGSASLNAMSAYSMGNEEEDYALV